MLKKVKFSNFKMFKKETIINLIPSKSEILKDTNVNKGILRGGLFYGSNASGKTTALHSISILLDMLFKDFVFDDKSICLFSKTKEAKFEYTFDIDNHEIVYSFAVKTGGIITKEKLFLDKEQLLDRILNVATNELTENKEPQKVADQLLFLRVIYFNNRFVNNPILEKWIEFLKNSIYIDSVQNRTITFNQETFIKTNLFSYLEEKGTDEINEFFKEHNFLNKLNYNKIIVPGGTFIDISLVNLKTECTVPLNMESYGNKLLLQLLPYILTIKNTGGMLLIDEFGGGLHNKLTELIVNYVFKYTSNVQLFAVTHETNLLKTSIIRPDQIFIIDYDKDGSLITKASNQSPRESQNLEKMYLAGVFGGIPMYD